MQQSLRLISLSNYVFVLEISQISGIMRNVRMLIKNCKAVALFQVGPCWLSVGSMWSWSSSGFTIQDIQSPCWTFIVPIHEAYSVFYFWWITHDDSV